MRRYIAERPELFRTGLFKIIYVIVFLVLAIIGSLVVWILQTFLICLCSVLKLKKEEITALFLSEYIFVKVFINFLF